MSKIKPSEIKGWSCTKLQNFFDSKSPNWMIDNLSLEAVMALHLKIRGCSPSSFMKAIPVLRMVKHAIYQHRGTN